MCVCVNVKYDQVSFYELNFFFDKMKTWILSRRVPENRRREAGNGSELAALSKHVCRLRCLFGGQKLNKKVSAKPKLEGREIGSGFKNQL